MIRQQLRTAIARGQGGMLWIDAFLTEWEANEVVRLAAKDGLSLSVAAGELIRRGINNADAQGASSGSVPDGSSNAA